MIRKDMMNQINDSRRKNYLIRERINQLLTPGPDDNLIAVTGGSGFGKTRAIMGYIAASEENIIWMTLTDSDNYPARFWKNFTNSMSSINAETGEFMTETGFPADPRAMHFFYNQFKERIAADAPCIFVFDDFHCITDGRILKFINMFISWKLPQTHIYILSRNDLSSLELKETYPIITEQDLAFRLEEIEAYFTRKGLHISYKLIKEVLAKTNGWPFAVYLMSLAAQNNENLLKQSAHFSDFLIFNTIDQEIFSKYSKEAQNFILRMSLLETHPVQLIEDLYSDELAEHYSSIAPTIFIYYSHHRRTYHGHHMFMEFLKSKQDMLTEEEKEETYLKAAKWYGEHGMVTDEMICYQRAQNYEVLWNIIWESVPGYYSYELAELMLKSIDMMPKSFKKENPMVYVVEAALQQPMGDARKQYDLLVKTIDKLESYPQTPKNREALGDAYANLAFYYMQWGETDFVEYFQKAAEILKKGSRLYRKPFMFLMNGDPITLKEGKTGEMEEWVTALEEAEPYYTRVLNHSMDGMAVLARGMALYYRGDTHKAEEFAIQAVYKGRERELPDIVCCAYFLIIRLAAFKGDYKLVMQSLENMEEYVKDMELPAEFNVPDVARSAFYGKIELNQGISDWIINEKNYSMNNFYYMMGMERIVKANSMLVEGNYYEMIPYLKHNEQIYRKSNRYMYLLHTHILQALSYYYTENMDMAAETLYKAYLMSYKNEILMVSATYGKYSRSMLGGMKKYKKHRPGGMSDESYEKLLKISDEWLEKSITKSSTFAKRVRLIREQFIQEHPEMQGESVVLTDREKEVLSALCEGLTREEIADNVNISVNTVKSTLNNIYTKLGAINSAHAVRIAMLRGVI